jgi:hypothetical protein
MSSHWRPSLSRWASSSGYGSVSQRTTYRGQATRTTIRKSLCRRGVSPRHLKAIATDEGGKVCEPQNTQLPERNLAVVVCDPKSVNWPRPGACCCVDCWSLFVDPTMTQHWHHWDSQPKALERARRRSAGSRQFAATSDCRFEFPKTVSFSSARTTKRFPSSRWASATKER